jgi:tetratricopeptide (TPR) repeat protein
MDLSSAYLLNLPRSFLLLSAAMILCSISGSAQLPSPAKFPEPHHADRNANRTLPPQWILEVPILLTGGLGRIDEAVTTSSAKAQSYYDQGLSLLYSYEWIRAARSFYQALREDPDFAMGYLGLSFAFSGLADDDAAAAMAQKAQLLAHTASAREQLRIELRQNQLMAMASPTRMQEYTAALDSAVRRYPVDPVLLLLRGNAAEGFAAGMGQRGQAESIGYYERVLQLDTNNFAAHHFLVHSQELVGHEAAAIKEAQVYTNLAPAVPHAHHMYGHELLRAGRLHKAIAEFEKSLDLENSQYATEPELRVYDWHYRHNLVLLASAYRQAGQLPAAERTLKTLASLPILNISDGLYQKELPGFLLETGRMDEAVTAAQPMLDSRFVLTQALGHAIVGNACAWNDRVQCASDELKAAEEAIPSVDLPLRGYAANWTEILRAQIGFLTGNRPAAISLLMQRELAMSRSPGTDAWSDAIFILEFISSFAAKRGEWDLARFTAARMQEHAPKYRGTCLALMRVAEHQSDSTTAQHGLELPAKTPLPCSDR